MSASDSKDVPSGRLFYSHSGGFLVLHDPKTGFGEEILTGDDQRFFDIQPAGESFPTTFLATCQDFRGGKYGATSGVDVLRCLDEDPAREPVVQVVGRFSIAWRKRIYRVRPLQRSHEGKLFFAAVAGNIVYGFAYDPAAAAVETSPIFRGLAADNNRLCCLAEATWKKWICVAGQGSLVGHPMDGRSRPSSVMAYDPVVDEIVGRSRADHTETVRSIAVSPDKKLVISGQEERNAKVLLWDLDQEHRVGSISMKGRGHCTALYVMDDTHQFLAHAGNLHLFDFRKISTEVATFGSFGPHFRSFGEIERMSRRVVACVSRDVIGLQLWSLVDGKRVMGDDDVHSPCLCSTERYGSKRFEERRQKQEEDEKCRFLCRILATDGTAATTTLRLVGAGSPVRAFRSVLLC